MVSTIAQYFNSIARILQEEGEIAGTAHHAGDIGLNRESKLVSFLNEHLPRRLQAFPGGKVLSPDDTSSKQLDIIVSSDIGVRFEHNQRNFVTAESVASAITIKSNLDSASLHDSLLNIASIPRPDPNLFRFPSLRRTASEVFLEKHPTFFIFSYNGMKAGSCENFIRDFYASKEGNDLYHLRPNAIIVNNSYLVYIKHSGFTPLDRKEVPPNEIYTADLREGVGFPYAYLLNEISAYISWQNFMDIHIHPYFNKTYKLQR